MANVRAAAPPLRMPVWDRLVRALHWLLVISMLAALVTAHWPPECQFELLHYGAGYLTGAIVLVRIAWGFVGTWHARFSQFVRGPRPTWQYAGMWSMGRVPRYIGHNPLGAWMVLALLATALALSLSGCLYTTEWLWGYAWLENLHAGLAWLVVELVLLHIAGVAMSSLCHRENLVGAMVHGFKRTPGAGDVP